MPLEIRELVIKASVETGGNPSGSTSGGPGSGTNGTDTQEQLIQTCVEKVLEILKAKTER